MMPFPPSSLPFGINLWVAARLMTLFAGKRPLDEILMRSTPATGERAYTDIPPLQIVNAVKRSVARPWRMRGRRCLREGLLAFHFLSLAGHRPMLHFGMVATSALTSRPRAHCWVTLNGKTVMNPAVEPMLDLFTYDGSASVPAPMVASMAGASHD